MLVSWSSPVPCTNFAIVRANPKIGFPNGPKRPAQLRRCEVSNTDIRTTFAKKCRQMGHKDDGIRTVRDPFHGRPETAQWRPQRPSGRGLRP
ncbi:hypothetical protein T261_2976 [Streptomyces lydicus]|nr:hypothetical protein T261_2976 [Streptomyces lydicus]